MDNVYYWMNMGEKVFARYQKDPEEFVRKCLHTFLDYNDMTCQKFLKTVDKCGTATEYFHKINGRQFFFNYDVFCWALNIAQQWDFKINKIKYTLGVECGNIEDIIVYHHYKKLKSFY